MSTESSYEVVPPRSKMWIAFGTLIVAVAIRGAGNVATGREYPLFVEPTAGGVLMLLCIVFGSIWLVDAVTDQLEVGSDE